jgi:hypothetical protein
MLKDALQGSRGLLVAVMLVGNGLAGWAGAADAEELTVYGHSTVLEARAAREALQAQMRAYSRSLDRELRQALEIELRETVAPRLMLAAVREEGTRG